MPLQQRGHAEVQGDGEVQLVIFAAVEVGDRHGLSRIADGDVRRRTEHPTGTAKEHRRCCC